MPGRPDRCRGGAEPVRRSARAAALAVAGVACAAGIAFAQPVRPSPVIRVPGAPAFGGPGGASPAGPGTPAPSPAATSGTSTPPTGGPAAPASSAGAAGPGGKTKETMPFGDVQQQTEFTPRPPSYMVDFTLEDADLPELIRVISNITGKRFVYGAKVRNIKANVYSPKGQKISVAEAYQVFLSILETNGLTVIPHGRYHKIVDSAGIATQTTPVYDPAHPVPPEDRYVTRLYRTSHIGADEVSALLGKFKSKDGDISLYAPGNLLIVTDTAANVRRMLSIVQEIDVGGAGDQVWVEPVHYGTATEMAQRLNEIFDVKAAATKPGAAGQPAAPAGGELRISKIIADDRTNSLIVVATERAYLRILELIRRLDVPQSGEGTIHVLPLQHAMAEELAQTLNNILTGAGGAQPRPAGQPAPAGQVPTGVFEGGIKVTADKATNSLVITSSIRDYAQLRTVIDRLDQPRRQVFIEAVIMDLGIEHSTKLGLSYHGGATPDLGGGSNSLLYGGFNPLSSILLPNPNDLQGLALGVRGPGLEGSTNLLGTGLTIPAFGVVLNALAKSGDVNVLATPHIIATDNVAAEINVGENIPLQTNVGGFGAGIPGIPATTGAATGTTGALGALGGLGLGFGGFGFSPPRQDVGTKIKVVPHMNDSNEVRLELTEEISEQGASAGTLGVVSITKRNAQTTVVVKDQQTVVIGGLMRDAVTNTESKVPILGDIPVLGFLFRNSTRGTKKTNLVLVLTPYVIRDQTDLRTIFERKMQERQEFLDRYFVFSDQKAYRPPRDWSRTNGLLEDIRQTYRLVEEKMRIDDELRPRQVRTHEPGNPIDLPAPTRPHSAPGGPATPPAGPVNPSAPTETPLRPVPPGSNPPAPTPPQSGVPGGAPPVIVAPLNRNIVVDRQE